MTLQEGSERKISTLPKYLRDLINHTQIATSKTNTIELKSTSTIGRFVGTQEEKHVYLLLRVHVINETLQEREYLEPRLIWQRSQTYESLGFSDLAAADAYIAALLCETWLSEDWVSDLVPETSTGKPWPDSGNSQEVLQLQVSSLIVLYRSLVQLGAIHDAKEKYSELLKRHAQIYEDWTEDKLQELLRTSKRTPPEGEDALETLLIYRMNVLEPPHTMLKNGGHQNTGLGLSTTKSSLPSKFGFSRREIYPWNEHEPDRNTTDSVQQLNVMIQNVAPDLEAGVTALPALNDSKETWYQLGLFAKKDLAPSTVILHEKSILTAIRPLDDALCDACGADLESIPREEMRGCPGQDCDATFCSDDCATRAKEEYHRPNTTEDEDSNSNSNSIPIEMQEEQESEDGDYPPANTPFCGNSALHEIGRTSTTSTPEWDLYFLLLTRTISIATTQNIHPLDLPSIKYLWADFEPSPNFHQNEDGNLTSNPSQTLPFSLYHNIMLPIQFFETLFHSLPSHRPYTKHWLLNFDFWVIQTLYAKFRGVANAQQSTFDGKAEIAAVHPCWCLANHSCTPNVEWTPTGVRMFKVRQERVWADPNKDVDVKVGGSGGNIRDFGGIRKGDQIWSHYTDVRLDVKERRERLREVLGGICRCARCIQEADN